ncbi:hypothetical protein QJS66_23640 (plasmid) [Kocuria rhizophila]|nr:hypothetical protein QJS66_23640 [Kocuria rhizophila]
MLAPSHTIATSTAPHSWSAGLTVGLRPQFPSAVTPREYVAASVASSAAAGFREEVLRRSRCRRDRCVARAGLDRNRGGARGASHRLHLLRGCGRRGRRRGGGHRPLHAIGCADRSTFPAGPRRLSTEVRR